MELGVWSKGKKKMEVKYCTEPPRSSEEEDELGRSVKKFKENLGAWPGIQNILVELDAKTIVDILQSNKETNSSFSPLLYDCRLLLRSFLRAT